MSGYNDPRYLVELNNYTKNQLDRVFGCYSEVDKQLDDSEYLSDGKLFTFPSIELNPVVRIYRSEVTIQLDFYVGNMDYMIHDGVSPVEEYIKHGSKSSSFCRTCACEFTKGADLYLQNRDRYKTSKYYKYYLEMGLLHSCSFLEPCDTLNGSHCDCCLNSAYFTKMVEYLNKKVSETDTFGSKYIFLFIEGGIHSFYKGDDGFPTTNLYASYTKVILQEDER